MGSTLLVLAYIVSILTALFSLILLLANTLKPLNKYVDASSDLFSDIKIGFNTALVLLFASWFMSQNVNFAEEVALFSNSLRYIGLIWFSFTCLCAIGLLVNTMLVSDKTSKLYITSRANILLLLKYTGVRSIVIVALSWLFSY